MKVPLSVEHFNEHGKEKLSIWNNGKNTIITAPIKPYFYSYEQLTIPNSTITKVEGINLSKYQKKTFYKYEFDTVDDLTKARDDIRIKRGRGVTFEDNIPFVLRCRVDNPDIYTKYAHTEPLKFDFLDIEQYCPTTKLFPNYDDRIISITFSGNDRKLKTLYLNKESKDDKELLLQYSKHYSKPDIEILYNKDYDLPTIFERCAANGINTSFFTKNGHKPYFGGKKGIRIDGSIVYDIYDSAEGDQTLSGNVPNKGLKAVSNYFGFKESIEPIEGSLISDYIGTPELVMYNQDDVRRLFFLFDIYWNGIEYTANDLKIPLSDALALSITDLGIVILGDLYREHGIIADGDNESRYPEIFKRDKKQGENNYQGALVYIKRRGLFKPLQKLDYSSMYPRICAEMNFSPDVCTLVGYEPYKKTGFRIEESKDTFTYYIPDNQINKTVVIQTLKKKGFLSKAIGKLVKDSEELKKLYNQTKEKKHKAQRNILKVKANGGIYGNMGTPHGPFGFAPAAVGTTGIGRECGKLLVDVLEKLYPESVIEVDTDGVYFHAENANEERIMYYFNEALKEKFKRDLNLTVELENYDSGYFHKAKNYILKTKKGDIVLHGAALKASSKDNISRALIQDLAKAKLNNESTEVIVQKYKNLTVDDFPLKDFAMQVTMGMNLDDYTEKGKKSKAYEMAQRAYAKFGIKPKRGNSYHYIKVNYGYELYQLTQKEDVDVRYYREKVENIIELMQAEYDLFEPIGSYFDETGTDWDDEEGEVKVLKKENQPASLGDYL